MTLELESYYQDLMATKGRSASICAPGCSAMEAAALQHHQHRHQHPPNPNSSSRGENGQSSRALLMNDDYSSSRGSGGNMQITSNTPTRPRKHAGAHRSQSARVVGSRPKIKRREQDLIKDYQTQQQQQLQQHLDLASSEGALRDCQESYNPFIRKVPSAGRLITSTSLEMSNNSLHGTPPPPPSQHPHHSSSVVNPSNHYHHHSTPPPLSDTPRDSPKFIRRHSGGERRGSADQKCTPEKDAFLCSGGMGIIPTIATPEGSPLPSRRPNKPTGLPKSPQPSRSNSTRRVNSVKSPRSKPTGYLDVPDNNPPDLEDEDEESYRLRSFSVTPKGIVNRGDSFRRRRSRSNSLIPTPTTSEPNTNQVFTSEDGLLMPKSGSNDFSSSSRGSTPNPSRRSSYQKPSPQPMSPTEPEVADNHRVAMIGARGVGKSALVSQFLTSESINAYDRQNEVEGEETVSVMLNGEESEMTFFKMYNPKTECNRLCPPDAFVLVYSVVDRASFVKVETELRRLQEWDLLRTKAVVIVANKIDLARSRAVSTQDGRCLAVANRVKFTEVSVGINHNVDELLVGLLHQIRLKNAHSGGQDSWCKHRGIVRASVKARQMLTWLLGKEDAKFKNCENLHIL